MFEKFTPGPWHAVEQFGAKWGEESHYCYEDVLAYGKYRGGIASCYPAENIGGITREEAHANAALIAAAPELYAMLNEMIVPFSKWNVEGGAGLIERAREALAKARGEDVST